jgi:hypothetical protein
LAGKQIKLNLQDEASPKIKSSRLIGEEDMKINKINLCGEVRNKTISQCEVSKIMRVHNKP